MTYVITQNCCKDASCVPVCPVDCIRPADGDAGAEMLYIDPASCIDCGACVDECPVDAIHYEDDLPADQAIFREINAAYFDRHPLASVTTAPPQQHSPVASGDLTVAVVGAGPAACYAAMELVAVDGVQVNLFDRLPTPFGLVRAGVAPDHLSTKAVVGVFGQALASPQVQCHFNVEIGRDITHDDLIGHHHAVIYAVGASQSRQLGIPGEDLPGIHAAADFVGWYNGHPDHAGHTFDLSGERAVVVGNGNVAVDVARVLLASPEALAGTDIAQHALDALAHHEIREVVILGRRDLRQAAFTLAEFAALGHLDEVDVIIEGGDWEPHPDDDVETELKLRLAAEYAQRTPTSGRRRLVLRFLTSPTAALGTDRVESLQVARSDFDAAGAVVPRRLEDPDGTDQIVTSLVLRSVGYFGRPVAGLDFEPVTGTVPNDGGRVLDAAGDVVPGVYVTGWIKRGPRGVIGTNRLCAQETVARLFADFDSEILERDIPGNDHFAALVSERGVTPVDWQGWCKIDTAERERGAAASRPRVKIVGIQDLLAVSAE